MGELGGFASEHIIVSKRIARVMLVHLNFFSVIPCSRCAYLFIQACVCPSTILCPCACFICFILSYQILGRGAVVSGLVVTVGLFWPRPSVCFGNRAGLAGKEVERLWMNLIVVKCKNE